MSAKMSRSGSISASAAQSAGSAASSRSGGPILDKADDMDHRFRRLYRIVKGKDPEDPYHTAQIWPRDAFETPSPAMHGRHAYGANYTFATTGSYRKRRTGTGSVVPRERSKQTQSASGSLASSKKKSGSVGTSSSVSSAASKAAKHEKYRRQLMTLGEETENILLLIDDAMIREKTYAEKKAEKRSARSGSRSSSGGMSASSGAVPGRRSTRTGRKLYTPLVESIAEETETSDSASSSASLVSHHHKHHHKHLALDVTHSEYLSLKARIDSILDAYFRIMSAHYHETGAYKVGTKDGEDQEVFAKFAQLYELYEPIFGMEYLPAIPKKYRSTKAETTKRKDSIASLATYMANLQTSSPAYYFSQFDDRMGRFRYQQHKRELEQKRAKRLAAKDSRYWNKDMHLFDRRPPFMKCPKKLPFAGPLMQPIVGVPFSPKPIPDY